MVPQVLINLVYSDCDSEDTSCSDIPTDSMDSDWMGYAPGLESVSLDFELTK